MVAAAGGFHGRTMGALALTGQPAKQAPFLPLPGDVTHVPYGDVEALQAAVTTDTALVMLEPVQGENGVVVPPGGLSRRGPRDHPGHRNPPRPGRDPDRYRTHRTLVRAPGARDRAGRRHPRQGARRRAAHRRHAGLRHRRRPADTWSARLDLRRKPRLLRRRTRRSGHPRGGRRAATGRAHGGALLRDGIAALDHPLVDHIRGAGLLLGIVLSEPLAPKVQHAAQEAGLLVNAVAPDVVRLAPPLIITEDEAETFLRALPGVLDAVADGAHEERRSGD
ncbi:hypothetical protein GCM10020000_65750 [Streptomyces olivoverticillatus]